MERIQPKGGAKNDQQNVKLAPQSARFYASADALCRWPPTQNALVALECGEFRVKCSTSRSAAWVLHSTCNLPMRAPPGSLSADQVVQQWIARGVLSVVSRQNPYDRHVYRYVELSRGTLYALREAIGECLTCHTRLAPGLNADGTDWLRGLPRA